MNAVTEKTHLHGETALDIAESFGRIRRRYPPATASPRNVSGSHANRSNAATRDEFETSTLRVFAGNDVCRAAVDRTKQHVRSSSASLYHAAHAHRSIKVMQIVERTLRAVGAALERMIIKWRQRRLERATYLALRGLDDRTLRDLGFHRSEIRAIAAEVDRDAEYSRARAERVLRGFY